MVHSPQLPVVESRHARRRGGRTLVVGVLIAAVGFATNVMAEAKQNASTGQGGATEPKPWDGLGYNPMTDMGALSAVTRIVGVQDLWERGFTGKGVDIALIDTGVTRVPGLNNDNVIDGPDLSFDSQTAHLEHLDGFGHGTHMASIMVGSDPVKGGAAATKGCSTCLNNSVYSDVSKFQGVAPGARVISVKVGASDGAVDVTQVVAGIEWAIAHRRDPGKNIRIINLSYGTNSAQSYLADPIAFAAENAWRHGIVVVASGGNDGLAVRQLASPAYSPKILSVGTADPNGTLQTSDDTVPEWANHGTVQRPIDVVAPGVHVLGLRVPGSVLDQANPQAVVGSRFFRGSGTSQSAAVVSGIVATVLQRTPNLTPDQVKTLFRKSTTPFGAAGDGFEHSRGNGAIEARKMTLDALLGLPANVAGAVPSLGIGTLEASRGGEYVTDNGIDLSGERDIFGVPWRPLAWTTNALTNTNWRGGNWRSARWSGDGWGADGKWQSARWVSKTWA
jgi:serine protease AprX